MSRMHATRFSAEKEPWLAVSLSWLLPGAGHLYAGERTRALVFFCLNVSLYAFGLASLVLTFISPFGLPVIWAVVAIVFPALACFDVYRRVKRRNPEDFENNRALAKDPWLAVFLSLLLPGTGHAYLRKPMSFFLYLVVFLVLYYLATTYDYLLFILYVSLYALAAIHAYGASRIYRRIEPAHMVFLLLFMIAVRSFDYLCLPAISSHFLASSHVASGACMYPTIKDGDFVIVNRLVYRVSSPKIGDVVLFTAADMDADLLGGLKEAAKRIVATGGETVQVKDGSVFVNGARRDFGLRVDPEAPAAAGGVLSVKYFSRDVDPYPKYAVDRPYLVPEGYYFLLGDNVSYSLDSRYLGAVPMQSIQGRVAKIYWPLSRIRNLH